MKRIYFVKVERGNAWDKWDYQVVAADGEVAARTAKRQARKDSGTRTMWRVTSVAEQPGHVVC